jgi:hypothetical protein
MWYQFLEAFSQGQTPTHTGMVPLLAPTIDGYAFWCVKWKDLKEWKDTPLTQLFHPQILFI